MSKTQVQRVSEALTELTAKLDETPEATETFANWPVTVDVIRSWIPRLRRGSKFGPDDTIGVREIPNLLGHLVIRHSGSDAGSLIAETSIGIRELVGKAAR